MAPQATLNWQDVSGKMDQNWQHSWHKRSEQSIKHCKEEQFEEETIARAKANSIKNFEKVTMATP